MRTVEECAQFMREHHGDKAVDVATDHYINSRDDDMDGIRGATVRVEYWTDVLKVLQRVAK